ncbi:fructose-1,6-bisphosphatase-3 [Alkalibacterium gilvum]|uniref:Fructose-1,6-bisphosphatase class 3 n=1 Tax=Alkalibacterium gilvum TaxID=1130080 RepID=A0A1H6VW80_9LACT|nr:fructose-bisphosphatase class III [Alkalibacterium gilvum]SEJ04462.1 fructose-1,6-bisphosphatase-3 [Alkalibacterium gilvum]
MKDTKYLEFLKEKYQNPESVYTELINLEAIQNLPKGTELYLSDIHGASTTLEHILRTGSGNVREKIENFYGEKWDNNKKNAFSLMISYPKEALARMEPGSKTKEWYAETILNLIDFMRFCSVKYTRSKVRKALPGKYQYIIEELLYTDLSRNEKNLYYKNILDRLIELEQAQSFIIAICQVIPRLVIDHLHLVGDIFDRSSGEYDILEKLMAHHSVDIQWGNHDVLWMGAMYGSKVNLMTLLRIAARYGYLFDLEKTYGLNLRPLFLYAEENYSVHEAFKPKILSDEKNIFKEESKTLLTKVHQALAVIQFKLEGQIIHRRPEFKMEDRLLLDKIDQKNKTIELNGRTCSLDGFPYDQINFDTPYSLNSEEQYIIKTLLESFQQSEKIERISQFMLKKGSMYLLYNDHLLFHGCIPMDETGKFMKLRFKDSDAHGKDMLDFYEKHIRQAALNPKITEDFSTDLIWYAWTGPVSPLFGRDKMTTFERYYIKDTDMHEEKRNAYFDLRDDEEIAYNILTSFGLDAKHSKIINGHTPVKANKGEQPVKAKGKLFVIDGGMNKAYRKDTGIAGYSLLNNSYGFQLVIHQPFESVDKLFKQNKEDTSLKKMIDAKQKRKLIKDTTVGQTIMSQINDLQRLVSYIKVEKQTNDDSVTW